MDPNQTNPSSSTPAPTGGMIPIAQLEQLLRLLQPNLDLSQTLAALATPASTAVVPLPTEPIAEAPPTTVSTPILNEEEVYSGATEVVGEGVGMEADLADDAGSGPSTAGIERRVEAASVERTEIEVVREDIEQEVVERAEADNEVGRLDIESDRVEADMAEIEAEIREGRGPMVEPETSGVETRVEKEVVVLSDTEREQTEALEKERKQREEAEQIYVAFRRRKRLLMEESEDEEEGDVVFRPIDTAVSTRQPEPAREERPGAEVESHLEKKRKEKQVALPPKKKFKGGCLNYED